MSISPEVDLFWRFIVNSVEHILTCLDGLPEEDLNWRPLENANSLYVLAIHTMGNVEENILGVVCNQNIDRQRETEFIARGNSTELIYQRWNALQERILSSLDQLSPAELDRVRAHPRRGQLTGREALIVVASHAAEHKGHAELTRDLLFASRGRPIPSRKY